ncbi:MAG: Fe-S cluster assembly sulfur transfer protein SufU [Planctomycetota bacterium]
MGDPPPHEKRLAELSDLYREVILDHYHRPRGRKELACPDVTEEGQNPLCGDEVRVSLQFEGDVVKDVAVTGRGCAISTAAGSMLAEILPGKSREEVELLAEFVKRMMRGEVDPGELDVGDLDALAGVRQFPVRVKCALLAWVTLAEALASWRAKKEAELSETQPCSREKRSSSG